MALSETGRLAGSTAASGTGAVSSVKSASGATPGISTVQHSVLAGTNQAVALTSLFNVPSGSAGPAYLIVSGLDRIEYTAGYSTNGLGHLADGSQSLKFSDFDGDGWSVGLVFTYQASTGQYVNATYGALTQLMFDTGSNRGDTISLTLFGASSASLAASYASNPFIMAENPSYFTDYGSVTILTGAASATPPSAATPDGIVNAAMSYVGSAWNDNGCWILASDISAKAGASLSVTSTLVGIGGTANGEWVVAYDGPISANANWVNNLLPGEIVSFVTTSGGGHITTIVAGYGASAQLVDNITYESSSGVILDSANDGSASDVTIQAPHAAMQEFSGVNAASVVVYELNTPIVSTTISALALVEGGSASLATAFSVTDPVAGESVTSYQVYETSNADPLMLTGVADQTAISASTAATVASLSSVAIEASATPGTDTVEVRAFNGAYWGDWTALTVNVAAPSIVSAAAAAASTGTALLRVSDTGANVGLQADKLQAIAASGRLISVTVTTGLVPLSVTQLATDHSLLALLPASNVIQVAAATVAQAASLLSNAQVASYTIIDTAADIAAAIGSATLSSAKLTAITLTNPATPMTLTAAQYAAGAGVLALITGGYEVTLTGAGALAAVSAAATPHIASVAITDSAAHVAGAADALEGLVVAGKLGFITLTDTGMPAMSVSATTWNNDKAALSKIASPCSITVTGSTAAGAAAVAAASDITSVTITDSAADVLANIGALASLASGTKLGAIALTDAGQPTVALTATQYFADAGVLAKITSPIHVVISAATVAQAAALQASTLVTSFTITDTAANVSGHTALSADTKLASINVTGTAAADMLNLTGVIAPINVNLLGNTATVAGGLGAASLTFQSAPDAITLGTKAATITAGITGSSGIETISNFQLGLDTLQLTLGTASSVTAFNTLYNGQHAITLTGGTLTQGVVLVNEASSVTASSLLATHMHTSGGVTTLT